ncbi:hypothetical protein ACVWWP_007187 [Bradyrhizobium sp. LM3.6]
MVIRCSSVSTLTRIDWLAMRSPSEAVSSAADFFGAGFALASLASFAAPLAASLATGAGASAAGAGAGAAFTSALATGAGAGASIAVSRKARSSSSSDTSPRRSGRSRVWSASAPEVGAASTATGASGTSGGASATGAAATPADIAAMPCSTIASSLSIRSRSVPSGSVSVASSPARISLMRSIEDRITVTACPVTGMPSRNLPISVSPACASASRRGNPRKPQVPLMVWTRRKMLSRILALFGSCSNFTS